MHGNPKDVLSAARGGDAFEPPAKRLRAESSSPPESSSEAEVTEEIEAVDSATTLNLLQALVTHGLSVEDAVLKALSHLPRLRAPVLAALRASPALRADLPQLAELVEAVADCVAVEGRRRLDLHLSSFADVAALIAGSRNIVVLSGAGVSVSCGIPDFRSKGGLYEVVAERFGLYDPQSIFDLSEFKMDPKLFYAFAKDVMPSKDIQPSPTHRFISELARRGKLLRNYSQNIDGLEARAGVPADRLVLCHGSFLTATCMRRTCRAQISGDDIASEVSRGEVPLCRTCNSAKKSRCDNNDSDADDLEDSCARGVLKPDIVFFGEHLPERVNDCLNEDLHSADLILVLGTSLQVAPVARIPQFFPPHIPRLLVNRELVEYRFDVELLGNCDAVIDHLRRQLGWDRPPGAAPAAIAPPAAGNTAKHTSLKECSFVAPRRFLFSGSSVRHEKVEEDDLRSSVLTLLNNLEDDIDSSADEEGEEDKNGGGSSAMTPKKEMGNTEALEEGGDAAKGRSDVLVRNPSADPVQDV